VSPHRRSPNTPKQIEMNSLSSSLGRSQVIEVEEPESSHREDFGTN
jgi:hypothetical protein